ncbi:MAG: glycosyltransferase [Patescibacteria group bacterium]|nr:glycosyltransferase [Patescibacteria group bacterium]
MKKILIINTTFNTGGAAQIAKELFSQISPNFVVFFAYGRGLKIKNDQIYKFGNIFETLIHIFLVRFLGLEGFGSYFSTLKLIRFIEREKFDLIHLHNLHGYYLNFFMLINFLKKEKIAIVWTLHDEWSTTWLPAYRANIENSRSNQVEYNGKDVYPRNYFPFFKNFMFDKKEKLFSNGWNPTLVCPSQWLADVIATSYLNKFTLKIIYNGIDTQIFKPVDDKRLLKTKNGINLNKKIILFVAANLNDKRKGISNIINVAKILKSKDYLFIGIGRGELDVPDNVKIINYVYDKNELAEIYALSDLFCFASSAETFLLTVAESLACSTPVVGFDIKVVREIFKENVGILVKLGDDKSLAETINRLLDNGDERLIMGANGRKLVVNNYSKELFYQNYNNLYNKLLK